MTNEEIAREAALQCYNGVHVIDRIAIILAAIEEACKAQAMTETINGLLSVKPGNERTFPIANETKICIEKVGEVTQPQRREQPQECKIDSFSSRICERGIKGCTVYHNQQPQEWTPEYVAKMFELNFAGDTVKAICDTHNAALAAEQKQVRILTVALGKVHEQLAAERQRYENLERSILDLSHPNCKQLLADLAAEREDARLFGEIMALLNGDGGHYQSDHGSKAAFDRAVTRWEEQLLKLDKIEYAQHDKEVLKPLVQALEKIAQLISQELDLPRYEPAVTATLTDVERIARTALAKVKE